MPRWLYRTTWIETYQYNLPPVDIGQVTQLWQEDVQQQLQPDAENRESDTDEGSESGLEHVEPPSTKRPKGRLRTK
jgi:hypothetical protein